jgi:hypothetical protein
MNEKSGEQTKLLKFFLSTEFKHELESIEQATKQLFSDLF